MTGLVLYDDTKSCFVVQEVTGNLILDDSTAFDLQAGDSLSVLIKGKDGLNCCGKWVNTCVEKKYPDDIFGWYFVGIGQIAPFVGHKVIINVRSKKMIDYKMHIMNEAENKYTFKQSSQIRSQTEEIGYLTADWENNGFNSSWNDILNRLKTDEFKTEMEDVINTLREKGNILHSKDDFLHYCQSQANPQSRTETDSENYGVRVDTEKYAYLFRFDPNGKENNLCCYCYVRDSLDKHMQQAEKGIRFINPHYRELFRIPDGGKILIRYPRGNSEVKQCRYIDDYHVEIGTSPSSSYLYHICEFAEHMEANKYSCEPIRESLPESCYSILAETGEIIILNRNEQGYCKTDIPAGKKESARALVDEYNRKLGVSRAQEEAMRTGSMFGFAVPGADPKNYDDNGLPVQSRKRNEYSR